LVPYPNECPDCIAKPWCNWYNGKVPFDPTKTSTFCSPRYRLTKALELSRIPREYIKANLFRYKVDDDNREAYEQVIKPAVENIVSEIDSGYNYVFYNQGSGTGKTFAGVTLLNHYIYKTCATKRFDFETPLGLFVEYPTLIDDLRYRRDEGEVVELVEQIRNTPFLMLDDVGAGTISDFALEQTYLLINHRYNNRLATVYTTNFGLDQLKKVMTARIFSRMMSNAAVASLGGRDRRVEG
jgi:DNA replication protein DnaC